MFITKEEDMDSPLGLEAIYFLSYTRNTIKIP